MNIIVNVTVQQYYFVQLLSTETHTAHVLLSYCVDFNAIAVFSHFFDDKAHSCFENDEFVHFSHLPLNTYDNFDFRMFMKNRILHQFQSIFQINPPHTLPRQEYQILTLKCLPLFVFIPKKEK